MSINSIFLIILISIALSTCKETKKNCLVDIEIEYSEDYNIYFDQFAEMFYDEEEKTDENSIPNGEQELDDQEESDDEYTKVEQFIPANLKNNCNIESVVYPKNLQTHFKQIRKF